MEDERATGRSPQPHDERQPGDKAPQRRRRRYVAKWSVVLPVMALTWALMFYLIYRAIVSGRL